MLLLGLLEELFSLDIGSEEVGDVDGCAKVHEVLLEDERGMNINRQLIKKLIS